MRLVATIVAPKLNCYPAHDASPATKQHGPHSMVFDDVQEKQTERNLLYYRDVNSLEHFFDFFQTLPQE